MPSAANNNVKPPNSSSTSDKNAVAIDNANSTAINSSNSPNNNNNNNSAALTPLTPLRQAITAVEHKIRNLEKRKSKLESYRELQNSGKDLNSDQKTALAKINEVVQTLEFARDLYKQFLGIAASTEKEAKKLAKKEAAAKTQAELARLREILLVQDALNQMGSESVRDDFLNGRNGATTLTEADIKLLDDLYPAVTPKHEAGNATAFMNEVQTAAEHLLAVVDGKNKEVFGGSYSQIKEVLGKIHESGYLDQAQVAYEETDIVEQAADTIIPENNVDDVQLLSDQTQQQEQQILLPVQPQQQQQQQQDHYHHQQVMPPPIDSLSIENHQLQTQGSVQPPPVLGGGGGGMPLNVIPDLEQAQQSTVMPSPLEAMGMTQMPGPPEAMYYHSQQQQPNLPQQQQMVPPPQQQQPQPQPQQMVRPITEMLGTGRFFFLQESEIDTPETIPTQTFTNQSFVTQQPPPPIPLPPHFQTPAQQQ